MNELGQAQHDDPCVEAWTSLVGAYKTVHDLLNNQLIKNGFTFPQYRVMRVLWKFGAMPMNKLGEHMFVTPANITGLVDRLERRGYIERVERGTDRRIVTMKLTAKGKVSCRKLSIRHKELVNLIMRVLGVDELTNLVRPLQRIKEAALEARSHKGDESS